MSMSRWGLDVPQTSPATAGPLYGEQFAAVLEGVDTLPVPLESVGAGGTGGTDDIDAINSALEIGGTITGKPGGIYRVTAPIVIANPVALVSPAGVSANPGGSGAVGGLKFIRDFDGPLFQIESIPILRNLCLEDATIGEGRSGAALHFEAIFSGDALVRNPGFGLIEGVRVTSSDPDGAWEHIVYAEGQHGWLDPDTMQLPPIRNLYFPGCWWFGARTPGESLLFNRTAHVQLLGGELAPAPTPIRQGVKVLDTASADFHAAAFENLGDFYCEGDDFSWMGGKIGGGAGGFAIDIPATAGDGTIVCQSNGTVRNLGPRCHVWTNGTYYGPGHTWSGHVLTSDSAPAVAAGSHAGSAAPAPTVTGTDVAGEVSFGTGGAPTSGNMITLTWHRAYPGEQKIVITPRNAATAALMMWVNDSATTGVSIAAAIAPSAAQAVGTYKFAYHVIG